MNDKTKFTLNHAQILYQTLADIIGDRHGLKIKVTVTERKD